MQNLPPATPNPVFATVPLQATSLQGTSQPPQGVGSMNFAGQLALVQLGAVAPLATEPRLPAAEPGSFAVLPSQPQSISAPWGMSGTGAWFDPGAAWTPIDAAQTPPGPTVESPVLLNPAPVPIAEPIAVGGAGVPATGEAQMPAPEPPMIGPVIAEFQPPQPPIAAMQDPDLAPIVPAEPSSAPIPSQAPVGGSPAMPTVAMRGAVPDGSSPLPSPPLPPPPLQPLSLPSTPLSESVASSSLPGEPPTETGKDVAVSQPHPEQRSPDAAFPVARTDSASLDRPSALPADPSVEPPTLGLPIVMASVAPRKSDGRAGLDEREREDAPQPAVDPALGFVTIPAITQTAVPPPQPTVPSLVSHGGDPQTPAPSVSNLAPIDIGTAGSEVGGAEPHATGATVTATPAEPTAATADTQRRADMDLAAKLDQPTPSAEAIVSSQSLSQSLSEFSSALPPQGPSLRPEAPAPLAPDPRVQASVTDQIAPAMVSMGQAHDGAHRMTLRLNPVELGLVEIRIDRPVDAPTQVRIMVERPETLTLLLRDQTQLERALDQAGLPPDGRSLSIQVGPVTPPAPPVDPPTQTGSGQAGTGANLADGSAGSQDGPPRQDRPGFGSHAADGARTEPGTIPGRPRWLRAGLDITA